MGRARRRAAAAAGQGPARGARDALTGAAFAGRYGPGRADLGALERALEPDGGGTAVELGELAIAATVEPARDERAVCVVDGRVEHPGVAAEFGHRGESVLGGLTGEFALVLWDTRTRRGLIARDPTGSRPLFVAEHGGALLFASEVRNLLALLPARPTVDREALGRWLARAPIVEDRTLYAGIRRVPPGHAFSLSGRRWRRIRYWEPRYAPPASTDLDEAAAAVRAGIERATHRALAGAARPAVMLSGGLDSAALAAVGRGKVTAAYSGVFPGRPEVDETHRIRRVRDAVGLPGVEMELGHGSAIDAATEFIRHWALPPVSPNRFVWAPLYRRATDDGIDVMLLGDGGDELFGCSYYLIADRLARGRARAAVASARRLPGMGSHPRARWIARALMSYGARGALPLGLHERLRTVRGRSGAPDWLAEPVADGRWDWKRRAGPRWWSHLVHVLVDDPFGTGEQMSREGAMHGIDLRRPLLDPELVELVLSLPPDLAFDPHVDRPAERRALAGDLPEEVLRDVEKPVFNSLLESALAGPDREAVRELVANPAPELATLVHPDALTGAGDPPAPAHALDVWRVATAELWFRQQVGA